MAWGVCWLFWLSSIPLLNGAKRASRREAGTTFRTLCSQCFISGIYCRCSFTKSCWTLWPLGLQHARLLCPSLSHKVFSMSCPLSLWYKLTISSSVTPFCLQSFPASGAFPMSRPFPSGSQNIGASWSASVLPMNIQGWFPLGLTGLISMLSKGLARVFSNTTVQKHQFFGAQPSLWSNSHIHAWLLENYNFDYMDFCQ